MEYWEMIYGMICFALFVVLSSVVQNGLFIITRGDTYERPDGKLRDRDDMIAYWFYKLVMTEAKPPEKVYYLDTNLKDLLARMKRSLPLPSPDRVLWDRAVYVEPVAQIRELFSHFTVKDYLENNDLYVEISVDKVAFPEVLFYTEQKRYVLSKYLRKPLVECLKCYPSIWGSLIYWGAALGIFGYESWQWALWVPYLLSCSYVNTLLFYKAR